MGLPRLIGKILNTRTIYLYYQTDLILWPDWFYGFPPVRRIGVRDYRFSRERQFKEFSDSLIERA
jgi:hypothetical protein